MYRKILSTSCWLMFVQFVSVLVDFLCWGQILVNVLKLDSLILVRDVYWIKFQGNARIPLCKTVKKCDMIFGVKWKSEAYCNTEH